MESPFDPVLHGCNYCTIVVLISNFIVSVFFLPITQSVVPTAAAGSSIITLLLHNLSHFFYCGF